MKNGTLVGILLTLLFTAGCGSLGNNQDNDKKGLCKELKRRIIFDNGATTNNMQSMQENAELNKLNASYREADCDQS